MAVKCVLIVLLAVVSVSLASRFNATYNLKDNFAGATFYDNFDFFTYGDPTQGYVNFVDYNTAKSEGLISAGDKVYMGADHSNVASGRGRNSIRLSSKNTYNSGLIVIDLDHMPHGCGTWPAFWTVGPNWPSGGEIDIIEGVNEQSVDQSTLHTDNGCTAVGTNNLDCGSVTMEKGISYYNFGDLTKGVSASSPSDCCNVCSQTAGCWAWTYDGTTCYPKSGRGNPSSDGNAVSGYWPGEGMTGTWSSNSIGLPATNCAEYAANQFNNQGCGIFSNANSYGNNFNNIGGGVFATEWIADDYIRMFFFPRDSIPADLTSNNPNPSSWGEPYGFWKLGGNCPSSHFQNHQIIFDLTFCGQWAGAVFGSQCPNKGSCQDFVQNNPSAFTEAYWLINYVKVFA